MTAPEHVPLGAIGRSGQDSRSAREYRAALERETDRSLARDPKRWTRRRTNELPKNRSTEPEAGP